MQFHVLKFGGTSVSCLESWEKIQSTLSQHCDQNKNTLLVCSAPSQVSNLLTQALEKALSRQYQNTLNELKQIYHRLADNLNINAANLLSEQFTKLEEKLLGIALLEECPPRIQAQVLSFGELLLTRLAALYLNENNTPIEWLDAREHLSALPFDQDPYQHYLSSTCDAKADAELQNKLQANDHDLFITQGFIARNDEGHTVLLGRGGSDTSAAYFAAKLQAQRCEIWTDVPGIYTADPRLVPSARRLTQLDYEEAQEIAALGGKVLHPPCLAPLAQHNIPLSIQYTPDPEREGTHISRASHPQSHAIKALSMQRAIKLISIDTVRMWQQVGFLADIFNCFKDHHVSINLVSTSESNLTVSLDNTHHSRDQRNINKLLHSLEQYGQARVIGPCAAISVIGQQMRSNLPKLSQLLDVFKNKAVHLLVQSANDLNLTFVVDEMDAEKILKKMHYQLIERASLPFVSEQTWSQEFNQLPNQTQPWWQQHRSALLALCEDQQPHYVYNLDVVKQRIKQLKQCHHIDRVFYSIKANHQPEILKTIVDADLGLECVSQQELEHGFKLFPALAKERFLFTPNFAEKSEYEFALNQSVFVTVDNLYPLQQWPDIFKNKNILLRIDCGEGAGHHRFVHTAGSDSKFGIPLSKINEIKQALSDCQAKVIGLHTHSGSGILTPENWHQNAVSLSQLIEEFDDIQILDLGGGLGIVEKPGQYALDLNAVNDSLDSIKQAHPTLQLWLEPGRFLSAECGVLLAQVTQTKTKGNHYYVGINTGMNALIRPALYSAYHHIVNLTRLDEAATTLTTIVGPICESADVLGTSRLLPPCEEGDTLLIATAGAYGEVMSSDYNMRAKPTACIVDFNLEERRTMNTI